MNLFDKNNRNLIVVLGIVAAAVVVLGVLSIVEYVKVAAYNKEADEFRSKIAKLQRARRPSPIEANRPAIISDKETYANAAVNLRMYFGHPYHKAAEKFLDIVMDGTGETKDTFIKKYLENVASSSSNPEELKMKFEKFKQGFQNWQKASRAFCEEAAKVTCDPNLEAYSDQILLSDFGIERDMGGNRNDVKRYFENYYDTLGKKLPNRSAAVQGYGFSMDIGSYSPEDYPLLMRHIDVVGDLVGRRIAGVIAGKADSGLLSFAIRNGVAKQSSEPGEDFRSGAQHSNGMITTRYMFEVRASMDDVMAIASKLDAAILEHRVYVIKAINIYALDKDVEEAERTLFPKIGAVVNKQGIDFGGNTFCRAVFIVDYVADGHKSE